MDVITLYFDQYGSPSGRKGAKTIQLSVYFDHEMDNHHIQFSVDAEKRDIAKALRNLSQLIEDSLP